MTTDENHVAKGIRPSPSGEARWGLMTIYRVTSLFPRHINYTIEEGVPLRHALFTLILLLVYGIDPKRLFGLISQMFV